MTDDLPGVWTIQVGWTSTRPVRPDEHTAWVHVWASTETEAQLVAAQMVACRPGCEMPTSTRILDLVM